jgi:2-polyprenyl-3-methyl-5-hydroxy-6-metoxy-1,4-benzoquinol methylase
MTDIFLIPDRIKAIWEAAETNMAQHLPESVESEVISWNAEIYEKHELEKYQSIWTEALLLPGQTDLYESLVLEISNYNGMKPSEVKIYCDHATEALARLWSSGPYTPPEGIHRFYESPHYIFELMAWHSLTRWDNTPLAYVMALEFAQQVGIKRHLDFGCGVGSGTILFHKHGITSALGDISETLLKFAFWRLSQRGLKDGYIPFRERDGPQWDLITAMEVFEHLAYPIETLDNLHRALVPGGYLFIQLSSCKPDPQRPQHILTSPEPVYKRLEELGMTRVWADDWCWGHEIFQKGK